MGKGWKLGALALLAAAGAAAQTGRLSVDVRDEEGRAVPGVAVVARSPAMLVALRRAETGDRGFAWLPALAPGLYELELEKEGHATVVRSEVPVRLDRTTALRVILPRSEPGEILFSSAGPVLAAGEAAVATTLSGEDLQRMAVGSSQRRVSSILARVPAVSTTNGGARIFGSTSDENVLLFDGLDATDPLSGTFGAHAAFDAVAELTVHGAGLGVEHGRATGGVVSLLTRSGGREPALTLDARYRPSDFTERGDHFDPDADENRQLVLAATAGGPLIEESLRYFLAAESLAADRTLPGQVMPVRVEADSSLAKLTWQASQAVQLRALWSSDPSQVSGATGAVVNGGQLPRVGSQGSDLYQVGATGVVGGSAAWEAKAEHHGLRNRSTPLVTPGVRDLAMKPMSDPLAADSTGTAERDELRARLELPPVGGGTIHRPAVGLELSDLSLQDTDVAGQVIGVWTKDTVRLGPHLTLEAGLRYDVASYDDVAGDGVADLNELQPRLGAVWDLGGGGQTVMRVAAGRAMHPATLGLPAFSSTGGGAPNRIAPGLDPVVADELVVGVERLLAHRTSLRIDYVRKDTQDVVEDTCAGNLPVPSAGAECELFVTANLAGLHREYEGATLLVDSRPARRLRARLFYVWSRSRGNTEAVQGRGEAFDVFPWHFENRFGFLEDDRRHRLRLSGFVALPGDVAVALDGFWFDRFPFDAVAACGIPSSELCPAPHGLTFVEPRGSRRASTSSSVDVQVSKGLPVGAARLELVAAVSNALGREDPTVVCENVEGCGQASLGEALSWGLPRSWEAGIRLEW